MLHREIRPGVFQLLFKGNRVLLRDGREVVLQIAGKIPYDPLSLGWILCAEVIDVHQRVVDEMRPHLGHGGARPLPRRFIPLHQVALDQLRHQVQLHEDDLYDVHGEKANQKHDELRARYPLASQKQRDQTVDRERRNDDDIHIRPAPGARRIVRRDADRAGEMRQPLRRDQRRRQRTLDAHGRAFEVVFAAALEEIGEHQQRRKRGDQRLGTEQRPKQGMRNLILRGSTFQQGERRAEKGRGQYGNAQARGPSVDVAGKEDQNQPEYAKQNRRRLRRRPKIKPQHHISPLTGYRSLGICRRISSASNGLSRKPQAPVSQASKAYSR